MKKIVKKNKSVKIEKKFYVGSNLVLTNGWAHKTEQEAVEHAGRLLNNKDPFNKFNRHGNGESCIIVKIIRVVKRHEPVIQLDLLDVE